MIFNEDGTYTDRGIGVTNEVECILLDTVENLRMMGVSYPDIKALMFDSLHVAILQAQLGERYKSPPTETEEVKE